MVVVVVVAVVGDVLTCIGGMWVPGWVGSVRCDEVEGQWKAAAAMMDERL